MARIPDVFAKDNARVRADTCEPLKTAAREGKLALHAMGRGGYPGKALRYALPGVRSMGTWDARRSQSWGLGWHHNEGLELTWLQRGSTLFCTSDQTHMLRPGDLALTCPWQAHRLGDPHIKPSRLTWLILDIGARRPNQDWRWPKWVLLDPRDLKRLAYIQRHTTGSVWKAKPSLDRAFKLLTELLTVGEDGPSWSRYKIVINDILLSTLETLEHQQAEADLKRSKAEYTVELFLKSLPNHLAIDWDCGLMAKQCGLGANRFGQICRTLTNLPPMQYLNRVRIQAAREALLQRPGDNITQIALAHGFNSSQYFATVFRQQTGSTPSAFRQTRR